MPPPNDNPYRIPDQFTQDHRWDPIYGTKQVPRPPSPFGLNPSQPGGPLEGALQSILPMLSEFLRQRTGGFGFMFGADQNIAQSKFARDYLDQINKSRGAASEHDAFQIDGLFRGLAVAMGHKQVGSDPLTGRVKFGGDVERSIQQLAGDAKMMLPVLAAMFPDTIDRALPRGSLTVAAGSFVNAGRYLTDPATGKPLSERADYAYEVLRPLLAKGPQETAGLGAGRLGQVYEELSRHGLIDSGAELRKKVQVNEAGAQLGLDIGMSGGEARQVQSDRVRERLKQYSQTIAAIKDIFAENGRTDAPMAELVQGLQSLTQGGLGFYDPIALARVTRELNAAGQMSGVSLEGLSQFTSAGGLMARQYGAHAGLAAPSALTGIAAGNIYSNLGFGRPGPGAMSRDEFAARAQRDEVAAAGSSAGNLIGALVNQAEFADAGSDLRLVGDALKAGKVSVDLPGGRTFDLRSAGSSDFTELFQRSGLSEHAFRAQLAAENQNRGAHLTNPGTTAALQKMRRNELEVTYLSMFGNELGQNGMDPETVLKALFDTAGSGNVGSGAQLANQVGNQLGLDKKQRSILSTTIGRTGLLFDPTGRMDGHNPFQMYSDQATAGMAAEREKFAARAQMLAKLSHFMREGWMRQISTAVDDMGKLPGGADGGGALLGAGIKAIPTIGGTALKMLGMVSEADANAALNGPNPIAEAGGPNILFGNGMFGKGFRAAFDQNGNAVQPRGMIGNLLDAAVNPPQNRFRNGAGVGVREGLGGFFDKAMDEAGRRGVPGPQQVSVKIEIGKLEWDERGGAVLNGDGVANV